MLWMLGDELGERLRSGLPLPSVLVWWAGGSESRRRRAVPSLPGTSRWRARHKLVITLFETMQDEMQDYFDERTEVWQQGERDETMAQRIGTLSELVDAVESLELA